MNRHMRPDGGGRDGYIRMAARDYRGECHPTLSRHPTQPLIKGQWEKTLRESTPQTNHFLSQGGYKMAAPRKDVGGNVFVKAIRNPVSGEQTFSTVNCPSFRLEELSRPSAYHAAARTARAQRDNDDFSISSFVGEGPEFYEKEIEEKKSPLEIPVLEPSDVPSSVPTRSLSKSSFGLKSSRRLKLGGRPGCESSRGEDTVQTKPAPQSFVSATIPRKAAKVPTARRMRNETTKDTTAKSRTLGDSEENCSPNIVVHSQPKLERKVQVVKQLGKVDTGRDRPRKQRSLPAAAKKTAVENHETIFAMC